MVFGYQEPPTVPCMFCGKPTAMTATKKCDNCWELDSRVRSVTPEVLLTMIGPELLQEMIAANERKEDHGTPEPK